MIEKNIVRFGVSIEERLLGRFDSLITEKGYVNRSEAIRDLIRDMLVAHQIEDPEAESFGTLTMVYNHHHGDISDKLNNVQHDYFGNIISTTHIHLDAHNCLEVLILKGKAGQLKTIADQILSIKNVKHGKFVIASTETNLNV
ncbi:MAG TPA: nickel-responsive transcriptional regulator NikR [Spirochaetota bacterium]|nr:nickel-responsive transcriptional regulator NikR [Spirochaetota bacterium]HPF05126.1 nickel-responsive transcriptional regulator NikR [Spirochaetota bacterium]HPJ42912.1 nickel-responsive transcriptional regulator NikR [Spirochaetota bacterium]HPR36289.1 nickel-responsive transcriptional regulator NikR [Spirochaetota bacterium]HRX48130.1 nickel-responsive transcriptional regulator NikR [Spirochaetota bacterium]